MHWKTSRREIKIDRTLVMAIVNVTPDSFSDGGEFLAVDDALRQTERVIVEGADIIDVGGESTRPGSSRVPAEEELRRLLPVVAAIVKRFDVPISVDTSKSMVAKRVLDTGAEIVNDISGLRFDARIADICAATGAGLVLMHSRGEFDEMHSQPSAHDIVPDVIADFRRSIAAAECAGIAADQIVLDVGLGFGKTFEQNLELIDHLKDLVDDLKPFPMLVGASRKSFIGKILDEPIAQNRVAGSVAAAIVAVMNGAHMVRVHDVRETVDAVRVANAIMHVRPT